jgi:putative glycosyltransferase (TIGR04372 family)
MKLLVLRIKLIMSLILMVISLNFRFFKEILSYAKNKKFSNLHKFLISINGLRYLDEEKLFYENEEITWFGISERSHFLDLSHDYPRNEFIHKVEKDTAKLLKMRNNLLRSADVNFQQGNWKNGNVENLRADRLEDKAAELLQIDPLKIRILGRNMTSSIGHTSFGFSLRAKMMALSVNPVQKYLVLPQRDSNFEYLNYWESVFQTLYINPRKSADLEQSFWFLQESINTVRISDSESQDLISAHNFYSLEWEKQERKPLLQLSEFHNYEGMKFLRENLGFREQDWFVTIHVRDSVLSKPNYGRNADITSYLPAIKYIVNQGGFVVRIGGQDSRKLPKINGFLDYANYPNKSRMLDVFFLAKAKFMIATTSGPIGVASSFGTPILWTNAPDIGKAVFHPRSLLIPKLILNAKKEILTMSEVLSSPLGYTDSQINNLEGFKNNFQGYTWRNNSEVEITNGVREMLTEKFNSTYPKQHEFISILKSYGNTGTTKIASSFLNEWESTMYS